MTDESCNAAADKNSLQESKGVFIATQLNSTELN